MRNTKKNPLKFYFSLAFLLALLSCSNDEPLDNQLEQYAGNYQIVSFESNVAVDLNNDGNASEELLDEISSFGRNDLEIRPAVAQTNQAKLLSFFFPKTWITFQYPSSPEGSVEFLDYGFATHYEFDGSTFLLEDKRYIEASNIDNIETNRTVTITSELQVINSDHLSMSIAKEYYDFSSGEWVLLNIAVTYEKQ